MADEKWNLEVLSPGERSILKRSAGTRMGNDLRAMEIYFKVVNSSPKGREREEKLFACLCMECLWREEDHPQEIPFEELLKKMYQDEKTSSSMKTRIINLLDIPWGDDGFLLGKICSFVKKIKSSDSMVKPDFMKLYEDLCQWNHPAHYIQRRWIRTICSFVKEEM